MSVLPMRCRRYLEEHGITFEEREENGQKAVILKGVSLPPGRFHVGSADILILLPSSYPDVAPDMFHATPWLQLVGTGRFPKAADVPVVFAGVRWQRWSRHNTQWRPGVDGIWTMLKRIENALEIAA
jgi:hypothetical protein